MMASPSHWSSIFLRFRGFARNSFERAITRELSPLASSLSQHQEVGVRVPPGAHTRPGRSGTAQPDRNRPGTRRSDSPEGLPGPSRRWSTGRRRSRLRPRGTGPVTSDDVRGRRAPAFGILVAAGSVGPAAPRHSDHASPEFVKPFQQSDPCLPRRRHGHITAT